MSRLASAFVALFLCLQPAIGETCLASWYGRESGRFTANGEHFNPAALTAASRSYKAGQTLRVSYKGRHVTVRVNDYGPARWTGRCLDVSRGAAEVLRVIRAGVGLVQIERLK